VRLSGREDCSRPRLLFCSSPGSEDSAAMCRFMVAEDMRDGVRLGEEADARVEPGKWSVGKPRASRWNLRKYASVSVIESVDKG
jgi:hypothetical protein